MTWRIEYDNDTGPNDEYLLEWWEVTNGKMWFRCYNDDAAQWLCATLNERESKDD